MATMFENKPYQLVCQQRASNGHVIPHTIMAQHISKKNFGVL